MRFIIFKKQYTFTVCKGGYITVDPVERIRRGLKRSTFRIKKKPLGMHYIRQGNYYKPTIPKDFNLQFYQREPRTIASLTPEEIQIDLGLKPLEMKSIRGYHPDLHAFFLEGMQRINRTKTITITDVFYLHYFNVIWADASKNTRKGTLEAYF